MKLKFTGFTEEVKEGITLLQDDLGFQLSDEGYLIDIEKRAGNLQAVNKNGKGLITYQDKIHFFRALGIWLENYRTLGEFDISETPYFTMNGAMLDASRNGVLSVESIKELLRKMSIMGLNMLMVYTEDTYEVKEYPYFGYMRGRYTEEELRACDQYAHALGIEMIPCVQTLAHLTEALKWNYAIEIRDTKDILLVDEPKTYEFIEHILTAAARPFQTKKIHIGMDEAFQLGLGRYLAKNGYEERFHIMDRHLQKVIEITDKLGLESMIWSDMYFRLGSKTGNYYDLEAEIPEEIIASIPDTRLVYWDYYHTDKEFYRTFLRKHRALGREPIFAGGAWTWNGIAPNYGKAIATTQAALNACKEEGVKEVFATMWGDNGAETPLVTALPMLQLFAEHSYYREVTMEHVAKRFEACTGNNFSDFMVLNQFDETPGVSEDNLHESHPSKFLLWQDVLIGLYDKNVSGLNLNQHYEKMVDELRRAKENNKDRFKMFDFYESLAKVLSIKAELGIYLKEAYDKQDKGSMQHHLEQTFALKDLVDTVRKKHRDLWFSMNKPFGWEVLEIRYGGVIARLETATYRIGEWITENVDKLEELEAERLHFEGPYPMPEGALGRNIYTRIATASNFS